jgi:hypothetical protein
MVAATREGNGSETDEERRSRGIGDWLCLFGGWEGAGIHSDVWWGIVRMILGKLVIQLMGVNWFDGKICENCRAQHELIIPGEIFLP